MNFCPNVSNQKMGSSARMHFISGIDKQLMPAEHEEQDGVSKGVEETPWGSV